jgi:lysophospholipase L1-like esterase
MNKVRSLLIIGALCSTSVASVAAWAAPGSDHWVGTWASSPLVPSTIIENEQLKISDEGTTLREIVRITLGGDTFRVRFTNLFGTRPLVIGAAEIAQTLDASSIVPGTNKVLLFHHRPSITIQPGSLVYSDPINIPSKPLSNLTVTFFIPQLPGTLTEHQLASATSFQVMGNKVSEAKLEAPIRVTSWEYLNGIDVLTSEKNSAIVTVGDSITDGAYSTIDGNARWPDILAERLQANPHYRNFAVLNEAISGNRILQEGAGPSAIARFDRDVLAQSGVKYLLILEGINDIGHLKRDVDDHTTAQDLIGALEQMITRAHAHGIVVIGATLTPFKGAGSYSESGEAMRQEINNWIRTSGTYDGVVDMEAATRDPAHPDTFLPAMEHGDHLHPNDAGYKAMGDAVDLKLFKLKPRTP